MTRRWSPRHVQAAVFGVVLSGLVWGCGASQAPPAVPQFQFAFDEKRAFADLEKQCSFGPRNPGSAGHAKCLEWIRAECARTADSVFTHQTTHKFGGKTYTFTNIIAAYKGKSDRSILLCAHWDTRPFADQELDPGRAAQPILGANDGASGVAALLELGRMFKAQRPPVGVILVFFDGEDFGRDVKDMFLGSTAFADDWKEILKPVSRDVEYGILLDMIGAKDLRIPREGFSQRAAPWLNDAIWENATQAGLSRYFPDELGSDISDDHLPLISRGIPTVDLISFDYAYWHTLEDTPDKCSPYSLKVVGEVVARTVYSDLRRPGKSE